MSTTLDAPCPPTVPATGCLVTESTIGASMRTVQLSNEAICVTLLPDKGADIYQLVYRPAGMDVLWKSPWGLKEPGRQPLLAPDSLTAFLDAYAGGWQVLFPNGGASCQYKGVELGFHGEATMAAWDYQVVQSGGAAAEVRLVTRLRRSPFRLERTVRLENDRPIMILHERITNEAREPMAYMWSHHPAFGAPFIDDSCRIDIAARTLWADDQAPGAGSPLAAGVRCPWPCGQGTGGEPDLSRVPGQGASRALLAYFEDFGAGWYAITNTNLGFGIGLTWPVEIFPFAWLWQEMHGTPGYPWYQGVYVMAIEPATSRPGQGLQAVMTKTSTHRILEPGETVEAELRAVFFRSHRGVERIEPDGRVLPR